MSCVHKLNVTCKRNVTDWFQHACVGVRPDSQQGVRDL